MTYTTSYTKEDYNLVISLRNDGFGAKKISQELVKRGRVVSLSTVSRWIYFALRGI